MIHINGLLVIVSSYVSEKLSEEQINISKEALTSLKTYFKDAKIIVIDNNSNNNDWYNFIKSLDIEYFINDSEIYKYESGAYLYALNKYRADEYLCIQHNIVFNASISQKLKKDEPDVYLFFNQLNDSWGMPSHYQLIECHNILNLGYYGNYLICGYCSFYCNNKTIDLLLEKEILTKIPCNYKIMSNIYERLFGSFFGTYIKKVQILDKSIFTKHDFFQQ